MTKEAVHFPSPTFSLELNRHGKETPKQEESHGFFYPNSHQECFQIHCFCAGIQF